MTDDHVFEHKYDSFITTNDLYKATHYKGLECKYCKHSTLQNEIGEYLLINNIKCLTKEEKIIKDLLE